MTIKKLKLNKEFRRLYGKGKAFVSPFVVTYILKNRYGEARIGITTGKKLGNAVNRNRARRIIIAAFRENLQHLESGYDFVFVARTRILSLKSTDVKQILKEHFIRAGIWSDSNEENSD